MNHSTESLILIALLSFPIAIWGAKIPASPEQLKKQADLVVTGKVISISSKIGKSKIETSPGVHRDEVFTIKILVSTVKKGAGVKSGDQIEIVAWKPVKRIPPIPGLQGHQTVPAKGDTATFFLEGKVGTLLEPILPNGISIAKPLPAKPKAIK